MRSSDCCTSTCDVVRPCSSAARMSAMLDSTTENAAGCRGCAATVASAATSTTHATKRPIGGSYHEAVSDRRLVLVTGASSGIGAACADVFAAHGFDVAITARREAKLQAVAAGLRGRYGVAVHVFQVDHADPASA